MLVLLSAVVSVLVLRLADSQHPRTAVPPPALIKNLEETLTKSFKSVEENLSKKIDDLEKRIDDKLETLKVTVTDNTEEIKDLRERVVRLEQSGNKKICFKCGKMWGKGALGMNLEGELSIVNPKSRWTGIDSSFPKIST